jgi:peroxiredoxin Q/BCP
MGVERTTYVIGPDGKIMAIFPKVNPEGHAEAVAAALAGSRRAAKAKQPV